MKIFVVETDVDLKDCQKPLSWYQLSDSALTNAGKPFYVPEGYGRVCVSLAPAIRINRLGKSIETRFASRYFSEIAPAVHFILPDFKDKLQSSRQSFSRAVSFDKSLISGEFEPIRADFSIELRVNGDKKASWHFSEMKQAIESEIREISSMNTVKMGDIIIPQLCGQIEIKEGDLVEAIVRDGGSLRVKVK